MTRGGEPVGNEPLGTDAVGTDAAGTDAAGTDPLITSVRRRSERSRRWTRDGEPSLIRFVGQIGVLGWIIVTPALIGLFVGRWLDHTFATGVFWSAPLLMIGAALGFWSAWRWMQAT